MKRIKNYLRSQMSQSRLSALALLSMEKEIYISLVYIDIEKTIKNLIKRGNRRIELTVNACARTLGWHHAPRCLRMRSLPYFQCILLLHKRACILTAQYLKTRVYAG